MASPSRVAAASPSTCLHCGAALAASDIDGFCCRGCAEVHRLLQDAGLGRFYDLGGGEGHPVIRVSADHKWLEPIAQRLEASEGLSTVTLDVQGVHCTACVWLIEKLFARHPEAARVIVNPAVGSVELAVGSGFSLARFVEDVESFGYRFGPPLKGASASQGDLVWRMGVCIAIAMNTMILGFAIYCGLSDGPVYQLFHALDFGLSLVSVLVGGTVFFRSAWQALRRRILHLDLPIALGILLVFASSTWTYATRGGATSYFDTLNVFIALMLVGRFLQERVVAKNRAMLLAGDGAEGLYTRRVAADGTVALIRCTELEEGDIVLAGRGDIVPVESALVEAEPALFSLDWISGESAPRAFDPGASVPAGAFSQGARAVRLRTLAAFDASTLVNLLRTSTRRDDEAARSTSWHARLTAFYVAGVLAIAALALGGWLIATGDVPRTLDVVAAVLIVTCPCAFGIATPLAYELAQGGLRRAGLFVRTPGFLDRAAEVTRIVFDKTGTLTTGKLVVENPEVTGDLDPRTARGCSRSPSGARTRRAARSRRRSRRTERPSSPKRTSVSSPARGSSSARATASSGSERARGRSLRRRSLRSSTSARRTCSSRATARRSPRSWSESSSARTRRRRSASSSAPGTRRTSSPATSPRPPPRWRARAASPRSKRVAGSRPKARRRGSRATATRRASSSATESTTASSRRRPTAPALRRSTGRSWRRVATSTSSRRASIRSAKRS